MLMACRTNRIIGLTLMLIMSVSCARTPRKIHANPAEYKQYSAWGAEVFTQIERDYRIPNTPDYYENEGRRGRLTGWPCGLYLMATATAARVQPDRYRQPLQELIAELDNHYWNTIGPVPGYDSEHRPQVQTRYYDDNCWIVIGLIDACKLNPNPQLLSRIKETYRYIFSGEDKALGGGIYWREITGPGRKSKNTCSNAPAAVAALKMYELTGERSYLEDGKRIMAWLKPNLQDPADHLFWDNKSVNSGRISRTKFTYNSGMPIQAWVLLYRHTHDAQYLKEAQATASSAIQHWFDPVQGNMRDGGEFSFTLTEALMRLSEADGNPQWRECAKRTALFVHNQGKDANGRYPARWNQVATTPYTKYMLRFSAPAGYLFWRLAEEAQPQ